MKRYDSYKPSGIDWIGEIPSHWEIIPIKYFYYLKGRIGWQGLKADEFTTEGPHLVTGTDFVNGRVDWKKCYRISEERFNEAPEIHVKSGDILITKDGTVGKLAYIEDKPEKVSLNSHLLIMRPLKSYIKNRYVFWYFHSKPFKIYSELIQDGSIMASLSQEDISNFKIILPSIAEQEAIADYLDKKCAEIDKSIANQQRRIELLEELKQSVITHAVTRGLDPNVQLRDSGIEWIGKIPSHWEIIPLKRLHNGTNVGESIDRKYWTYDDADTPFYTAGKEHIYTNFEFFPQDKLTSIRDLLMSRNGTPYVYLPVPNSIYTDHVIRVTLLYPYSRNYIYYALSRSISTELVDTVSLATWSASLWNAQLLPVPPLHEQQAIADYLDQRCAEIDSMISREKKKIELMQELKQSIITEVVTGKRKVV